MAILTGTTGSVVFGTSNAEAGGASVVLSRWTANIQQDTFESTSYANTANMKSYVAGMASISGSAEGFLDSGAILVNTAWNTPDHAAATITLTYSTGDSLAVSAILTNLRISSGKNEINTASFDFQGTGVITPAFA